jgi:hypothetical protein
MLLPLLLPLLKPPAAATSRWRATCCIAAAAECTLLRW